MFGESLAGVGLHTGSPARLTLEARPPGAGLAFVRSDLAGAPEIPACVGAVASADRATSLERAGVRVRTVEHVLATLGALGRFDARIHVFGPEVPIADGSAAAFVPLVVALPPSPRSALRPCRSLEIAVGDVRLQIEPADRAFVEVEIEFGPPVGAQRAAWDGTAADFEANVAPARTFAFEGDFRALAARGLVAGATPGCGLLFAADGPIVGGPLRYPDEPARHKLLDLVGDLTLLGAPLLARVRLSRGGHGATVRLLRALSKPGMLERVS